MNTTEFSNAAAAALRDAGFTDITLMSTSPENAPFGDAQAVFRVHGFVLRLVRDRGQEFVDLASPRSPADFHQVYDVERALGWKAIEPRADGPGAPWQGPDRMAEVLSRLKEHFAELQDAFSATHDAATQARIRQTTRARQEAFMRKLAQPPG